jgi:RHS repeat-associated protein
MLGGLWLLTRSAGTTNLSLPSGELKPLTAWTNELIVQNDELPPGWQVDIWAWDELVGMPSRVFGYKYPAALGQPGLNLKERVVVYSTTLLAQQAYPRVLDTYFPPHAADEWKTMPELTIPHHAEEMKMACIDSNINGIAFKGCRSVARYQNVIVITSGNVFEDQWLTMDGYRQMLETVDRRVTSVLSQQWHEAHTCTACYHLRFTPCPRSGGALDDAGVTYTQSWDRENRLLVVTNTASVPNAITRFVYDGDGNRVLQIQISGTQIITTAYASALEVSITGTQRITKTYYSAGSQLIAMRVYTSPTSSVLYYLHGDHLGSTSLTTDASGNVVARQLYDAWGNIRLRGDVKTDIGYTSQREDRSTNLMFYRARYYSPYLNRWLSPDSIVPDFSDPQSLNRFSYTLNNPVKYSDPSGHCVVEGDDDKCSPPPPSSLPSGVLYSETYGYFDPSHFRDDIAQAILRRVKAVVGTGGPVGVAGQGYNVNIPGTKWPIAAGDFSANYMVAPYNPSLDGSLENYITRVSLSIFMDYQMRFEAWEGTPASGLSMFLTGFAIEDLPSDYIGFIRAARGTTYPEIFAHLGPVEHREQPPRCLSGCANREFTPLVNGEHVPWPAALSITPIGQETGAWRFVSESPSEILGSQIVEFLFYSSPVPSRSWWREKLGP